MFNRAVKKRGNCKKQSTGYSRHIYAMARPRLSPPKQANGVLSPWNRQRSVAGERDPSWRRSKQRRRDSRPSWLRSLLIVFIIVMAVTGLIVCDDICFSGGLLWQYLQGSRSNHGFTEEPEFQARSRNGSSSKPPSTIRIDWKVIRNVYENLHTYTYRQASTAVSDF